MHPREQFQSLLWGLIWYLLPLSYIIVDRFFPFDRTINIYPLVLIQCSIALGLLYWGINKFKESSVRKAWIWTQAFVTVAIFQMSILGIRVFALWIDICLQVVLPILSFFTLYKGLIASSDINATKIRNKDKSK